MKIKIDWDEWYPVYSISDDCGVEVEVSEETLARWRRVDAEFDAAQKEMRVLVKANASNERRQDRQGERL